MTCKLRKEGCRIDDAKQRAVGYEDEDGPMEISEKFDACDPCFDWFREEVRSLIPLAG